MGNGSVPATGRGRTGKVFLDVYQPIAGNGAQRLGSGPTTANKEKRIIIFTIAQKWKWQDMFDAIEQCHDMMDTVDYPVRTVFNVSHTMGWPPNPLANMRKASRYEHPRSSTVAIVGIGRLLQSIIELFQRLYRFTNPNGVFFFTTEEEAIAFLEQQISEEKVVCNH